MRRLEVGAAIACPADVAIGENMCPKDDISLPLRWEFTTRDARDRSIQWKWRASTRDGRSVQESDTTFATFFDCLADARRHGFVD